MTVRDDRPPRILTDVGYLRYCHTCGCTHLHLAIPVPSTLYVDPKWRLCPLGHETVAVRYGQGAQGVRLVPEVA